MSEGRDQLLQLRPGQAADNAMELLDHFWPQGRQANSAWLRRQLGRGQGLHPRCDRPCLRHWLGTTALTRDALRLRSPLLPNRTGDLPLLLVVQGQPERVTKGHQGPFHRIGFGLLEGGFMG